MSEDERPIWLPPEELLALSEKLNAYWRGLLDSAAGGEIEKAVTDTFRHGSGYLRFTADGKVEHVLRDEIKQDREADPAPEDKSSDSQPPPPAPAA